MKIDNSAQRLPINRLKHPLREKSPLQSESDNARTKPETVFAETFERRLIQDGAKRFQEWLAGLEADK